LDLIYPTKKEIVIELRNLLRVTIIVLVIQIIWGAFVAGLDAGLIHNHWPLMSEGKIIHETVYIEQKPLIKNFIEGKSGVQFIHRYLAYIVVGLCLAIWFKTRDKKITSLQRTGINWILIIVGLQFVLGVFTLINGVPIWLGIAHQIGAFFLLAVMTFTLHRFSK